MCASQSRDATNASETAMGTFDYEGFVTLVLLPVIFTALVCVWSDYREWKKRP